LRKTAPDADFAGELSEVTTGAHTRSANDSENSLDAAELGETEAPSSEHERPEGEIAGAPAGPEAAHREQPLTAATSEDLDAPKPPAAPIDFDQAERFAASIRPSWADAPIVPVAPPNTQFIGATDGAPRVVRHNTRTDLTAKVRKRRGSSYAILGASLLGALGLLYLAIASSSVQPDAAELANKNAVPESARHETAQNVETSVHPAQQPEAPQLQAAEPAAAEPAAENAQEPALAADAPQATPETAEQPAADPNALAAADPALNTANVPAAENPTVGEPSGATPTEEAAPTAAEANSPAAPDAPSAVAANTPVEAEANAPALEASANAANAPGVGANALAANAPAAPDVAAVPAPKPAPSATVQPGAAPKAAANNPAATDLKPLPDVLPPPPSAAQAAIGAAPKGGAAAGIQVVLSLAAYPPNTRLRLDGALVENPARVRLPRSTKHRIDAYAPGYAPETHSVRVEADVQLMLSLKREGVKDVKANPYGDQRRSVSAAAAPAAKRDRGAGFVAENPY
jgi:hypothetical protein